MLFFDFMYSSFIIISFAKKNLRSTSLNDTWNSQYNYVINILNSSNIQMRLFSNAFEILLQNPPC